MTRPAVRLTLLVIFLAAMGTTACLFWMAERQSHLSDTDSRRFDTSARTAERTVFDLRTAQQAYVAPGQGEDFWISRSAALVQELRAQVRALKSEAASPSSALAFDSALSTLQDLEQIDVRAREYARSRQPQLASTLIFGDGLDLARTISDAVERGRTMEIAGRDEVRAALERREVFSLGAAAAAATLIVLLLMPTGRPVAAAGPVLSTAPAPAPAWKPTFVDDAPLSLEGFDAEDGWTPARPRGAAATAGHVEAPPPAPPPPPAVPAPAAPVDATPPVDLQSVAAVCNDLARIVDTRALPSLLERAAALLDASGVVVWIADPDGRELAPIVAHGYPAGVVTRLGTIPRDAENVTAAAFRTSLLQTVKADAVSNGAIAAPLVTPGGCVGVMAAEMRHEAEQRGPVLAVATIVAAQLAALVGPPSTRAKAEVAG